MLQYSEIFHFFLAHLLIFDAPRPKCSQKNIQKYIFEIKFPALSNAPDKIGLNIEETPDNRKNASIFLYF